MLLLLSSFLIEATHFRYGTINWEVTNVDPISGATTVEFTLTQAWRSDFSNWNPQVGLPLNGSTIGNIVFGDGTAQNLVLTVTSINQAENWFVGTTTFSHTYAQNQDFLVQWSRCCRISTLLDGNNDDQARIETLVTLTQPGNNSPVANALPIYNVQTGKPNAQVQLSALDPDNDAISYSWSTTAQSGLDFPIPSISNGLTAGGLLSLNTTNASVGSQYAMQVMVTDSKGAYVPMDFLVQIVQQSNPPTFDYSQTPASGTTYKVAPGQSINFPVVGTDPDPGSTVTLSASGIPVGATFNPGTAGNPVNGSFSWTPSNSNLGAYVVNFSATDNIQVQASSSVNIIVSLAPEFIAPTPPQGVHNVVEPGSTLSFTVSAQDPDPNDVCTIVNAQGKDMNGNKIMLYSGVFLTPGLPTVTGNTTTTDFNWTPLANQWGHRHVFFTAEDSYGDQTIHEVSILVNTTPTINSTPITSVIEGNFYSYTFTATDPDVAYGDALSINVTSQLPNWLNFVDNGDGTATLSGTPSNTDIGNYAVSIQLDDINHHMNVGGIPVQNFQIDVLPCPAVVPVLTVNNATCANNDGSISVMGDFGTNASYSWTGPNGFVSNDQNLTGLSDGTYTVIVTTGIGCTGSATATITGGDQADPVALVQNVTLYLDANGQANMATPAATNTIFSEDFSNDAGAVISTGGSITNWNVTGQIDVGNWNTGLDGQQIDLAGFSNGVIETKQTFNLSPGSYEFSFDHIQNTVSGNSVKVEIGSLVDQTFTSTASVQTETVNFTVTSTTAVTIKMTQLGANDANGSFVDDIALIQNVPASFLIDAGSYDDCEIAYIAASKSAFNCADVGSNVITLTITDLAGKSASATANVIVEDSISPIAMAQDLTVQLDASGMASLTAADVDNGSTDACGIASMSLDISSFDCSNVGTNQVILTVIDIAGNSSSATATITVEDNVAPVAMAQDITVQLDSSGTANISTTDVDNGSNDACGIASMTLDQSVFDCSDVTAGAGALTVPTTVVRSFAGRTLNFTNVSINGGGNVVTVAPGSPVTVSLDWASQYTSSYCPSCFQQFYIGVKDQAIDCMYSGYTNSNLSSNGGFTFTPTTPGVYVIQAATSLQFSCSLGAGNISGSEIGALGYIIVQPQVQLIVTDVNGNSSTATATVTVEDNIAPNAIAQDIVVQLDSNGLASIVASDVDNGSNDACGIADMSLDVSSFDCSNVGPNQVELTVTDVNGNISSTTATVTIEDNIAPVASASPATLYLDPSGVANITAADVDNGSNDACGIASISLSNGAFSCANVGANNVVFTATDVNGNSSTTPVVITVIDTVSPSVVTQNIVVQLDAAGNASITTADVNNGSSDACGIASMSLDITAFTCANVGPNTVTLSVVDNNGNSSSQTATVTVEDNVAPVAIAQDVDVYLDASGAGSITAMDVDNGSNDACGVASISVSASSFACANVGVNPVVLTVTDVNGNVSTANANVNVHDTVSPAMATQNVTVYLDANGSASITTADIDAGSSDACGINTLSLDITSFGCDDTGANTVVLTAVDANANSSSATAQVTVLDTIAPMISCVADFEVCENDVVIYDLPMYSDNCSVTLAQTDASGLTTGMVFPVGVTTIEYTAADASGNQTSCSFDVTVRALPAVSIATSELPEYCQGGAIVLSAVSPDAVAWSWSNGDSNPTTEVFASGTYYLTVTNQYGCINTDSVYIDYYAEELLSSYTIIGRKEVHLMHDNEVVNGGVGVMQSNKKAKIYQGTDIIGATTFVMADNIDVKQGASVTTQINGTPNITLPTFLYASAGCSNNKITVPKNGTLTLSGTSYGKIYVKEGGTLIFTQSDVSVRELKVQKNGSVEFTTCAYLRVYKKAYFQKNSTFNPDGYKVWMFLEKGNADVHEGSVINASIYALDGDIKARGKSNNTTYMNGMFIGEKVKGQKDVIWNWDTNCDSDCSTAPSSKNNTPVALEDDMLDFDVVAYPNPYVETFTIDLVSDFDDNVTILVHNMNGQVVEQYKDINPMDNPTMGRGLPAGMYFVTVTQSGQTKTVKVNKLK